MRKSAFDPSLRLILATATKTCVTYLEKDVFGLQPVPKSDGLGEGRDVNGHRVCWLRFRCLWVFRELNIRLCRIRTNVGDGGG